ncbi:NUDIX domain-containing protein [Nitrospirota bacterium]
MSERVLVVDNDMIGPYIPGPAPMLITERTMELYSLILDNHLFIPREQAEEDYTKKQPIPYVAVRHGKSYLVLRRTKNQSEKRLHDKLSLGIGGHINPGEDGGEEDIIMNAMRRELEEEVHIHRPSGLKFAGFINDESNSVSRVHLGLLFVMSTEDEGFEVREKDMMTAEWVQRDTLKDHYEGFETWSQIVYDNYIKTGNNGGLHE